jgi:hypothetical protein
MAAMLMAVRTIDASTLGMPSHGFTSVTEKRCACASPTAMLPHDNDYPRSSEQRLVNGAWEALYLGAART